MHDTENFKKNINEDYDIEEELGSGQFAVVRKIVEKETGDEFAAKYVRKKRTKASRNGMSREDIKREIEILQMVDSEKIIKVHDVYETDKEIILVMELLRGGELFDYISKKDFLTEEEAIDFTRQILLGLQHLHSRSVVHLDLKPENILLQNTRRKTIKLVDFGLARVVNENEQVREIMGTPEFVAPEVLNFDTISTSTDMWALGVIAYILLSGASPFLGEDNQETFTNIIQVDYQFDEEYFAEISDEAKDFIRKLLVKNPRKRPTAHDCSRHPWVEEELVVDKKKRQRRRTTQICTFNFKRFVARKRWKMSYNKIRAMNLIAKMGIKPPPGFITEIPPMSENNESVEPKPEEKPSSHKEHKKNQSTINRKKHKQSSNPKPAVEKTDSLTLKTMDIDIGEGERAAEPEPEPVDENEANNQVEPSFVVEEPVDYGSMTKREKRRARGQLRTAEIVKSKKEIDAKQAHPELEIDEVFNGAEPEDENIADEAGDNHNEVSGENAPAMDVAISAPVDKKPAAPTTVTSTMQIEHKPAGILKKRDPKATRIPSTEDHYFVTLNAALFQQEDTYYQSGLAPTRQHGHGILKHTTSEPNTSEGKTTPSEHVPNGSDNIVKRSESLPNGADGSSKGSEAVPKSSENIRKISDNRKVSEFTTVVEVNRGNVPPGDNHAENANSMVVGLQVDKAVAHAPEKDTVNEKKPKVAKSDAKPQNSDTKGAPQAKEVAPAPKKPLAKTDNAPAPQRAFSPPPWQRKSSNENLKPTPKPLHGVSKVSLKANRFLTSDKQATPKSPTSATTSKTSNVLGKSKLFQKEPNTTKPDVKKTAATKTNSVGPELKNVACDINLDDAQASAPNDVEISVSKPRAGSLLKDRSDSPSQERCDSPSKERSNSQSKPRSNSQLKVHSDSQSKPRSDSQSKTRSGSVKGNNSNAKNNNKSEGSVSDKGMNTSVQDARYRSNSAHKTASHAEAKVLNGEAKDVEEPKITKSSGVISHSAIQIPARNEEAGQGTGTDVNEELTSSSTHSLSEFTIRPRQNSGEEKAGGFDIMLTIAPPTDEPAQESRAVSSTKTRFTASSSALPDPRSGLPNGKLTSLSTSDVTSPNQGSKYTPQRDFSKYLSSDQPKSIKTTKVPANPLNHSTPNWQVKRNTPPASSVTLKSPTTPTTRSVATVAPPKTTIAPPKTTITPKSPTTPTRPASVTAKTAAAKVSATVALHKGKKSAAVTSMAYIPRRSFGFAPKTVNQSDPVVKASEPDDAPKLNNNDESKRWSQSSYTSDRSASSSSSDDLSLSNVTAENNALNRSNTGSNEQISVRNPEISRKIENHSERGNLSPRASPVLERKWKATLVLPKESEKVPARDRDIRISSTNAPRKNKFANMRSKWEGK